MTTLELLRKLPPPASEPEAWSCGVDCALSGPNKKNSHFSIFRTPKRTRQWGAGKEAAEKYLSGEGGAQ